MTSKFATGRTIYGGTSTTSLELNFPFQERIDAYTITKSNATKWNIDGSNDGGSTWTGVDTQSLQHKLRPLYACSTPGTYRSYRFTFLQARDASNVYVGEIRLTNTTSQTLTPNLVSSSNVYTCIMSGPTSPNYSPVAGTLPTYVQNGPQYTNGEYYIQSNIFANVVCAHIRYEPSSSFTALVGSINGGLTWSNVLALNSKVSSNLTPFNSFRLVGDRGTLFTKFEIYDPNGNLVNSNDPERGGAFRGSGSGEWVDLYFNSPVSANVYEFTTTNTSKFPTSWAILGSNDSGSTWTTLDRQSNVYDGYTRFTGPFYQHGGCVPYAWYRFTVYAFRGRSSAEIVSFNIFDDRGYRIIPTFSSTSITVPKRTRPHNIFEQPISTSPSTSPFIDGNAFVSSSADGQFVISFPVAVSVHKIYLETNTPSFTVEGSQGDSYTATVATVNSLVPSNVYPTSNTYCFRNFRFRGIAQNCFVSNVMMFNRTGGRINPYMSNFNTISSNVFGGPATLSANIQIQFPNTYANAYAVLLENQSLAKWKLESNISGTWQIIESTSNAYNKSSYFQNTFAGHASTGMILTVEELSPSKTDTNSLKVSNFNILGNAYTSILPVAPSLSLPSSTQGPFKIRASRLIVDRPPYRLFDGDSNTEFSVPTDFVTSSTTYYDSSVINGEWVEVELPFPKKINYFTFTTPTDPSETPNRWILLGSTNKGQTWSNILSNQSTDYFLSSPGPNQTNVFFVSNTTGEFTNFRFVYAKPYLPTAKNYSLKDLSLYGEVARLTPTYMKKDAGSLVHEWNTYTDTRGDVYGGKGAGEYIQLAFPSAVTPSYLRITANILPTSLTVFASNDRFATSVSVGSIQNNYTITNQQTLIPLNVQQTPYKYYRILATYIQQQSTFKVSEISFLNDRKNKMHQNFTYSGATGNDNLNQRYTVVSPNELGGTYQTVPQYIESNLFPNSSSSNAYIFRSVDASEWKVEASSNYTTWDLLDTQTRDSQVSTFIPQAQIIYYSNQTGNSYTWYRLTITNTFKTTDGCVRVTEFAPIDYKQDRILKYANGVDAYTGGAYKGKAYLQTRLKNYYGEYKTFTFERPVPISNATLTFDQYASIKGITFLGKNTETFWNVIPVAGSYKDNFSECVDKTLVGTYTFSGTTVSSASNAFTTSPYCLLSRNVQIPSGAITDSPYVQVTLPRPTQITAYEIYIPSVFDIPLEFSLPSAWTVQGSNDGGSTWTTLDTVTNDTKLSYNSSGMYPITNTNTYRTIRITFQRANTQTGIQTLIKQFLLYGEFSNPLYLSKIFAQNTLIQYVERAPLYTGPTKRFEFTNQVVYSNIAFVINNFTNDPYKSSGKLQIAGVDFQPSRFITGSTNVSSQYSYSPKDIVYGNAQSVVFYTDTGRAIQPVNVSFNSNTANMWSVYSSQNGKDWDVLQTRTTMYDNTMRASQILNPVRASWFKISIDGITNLTDGTTDVSNVHISESSLITWPYENMKTNSLFSNTILQTDSFGTQYGIQRLISSAD